MAATIKTVLSMPKTLFDQAEILARRLHVSRSELFRTALENFIKDHQGQGPGDEINPAGVDLPDRDHPDLDRFDIDRLDLDAVDHDPADHDPLHLNQGAGAPGQEAKNKTCNGARGKAIAQGDVYWVQLEEAEGSEPGPAHPYVVVQDNVFNRSRIPTLVACALTSNLKLASAPGNVLLEAGEANLPRQSVVVVSKISTIEKAQPGEYIGSLSEGRIEQILAGLRFIQLMTEHQVPNGK